MNRLALVKTAAALAPLALAALTAAITTTVRYDGHNDELTITIRKIRPVTTALAPLRAR